MASIFRELAARVGFTEGPVVLGSDRVAVTSMSRGQVIEVRLDTPPDRQLLRAWETGGGPNGIAIDPSGRMLVAQNGGRTFAGRSKRPVLPGLQVIDGAEIIDVAVPDSVAPNDCAFGPDGALWFTDPGSDAAANLGPRVRRWDPRSNETTTVDDTMDFPNGLAFSADGRTLYVSDSHRHSVERFPVEGAALGAPERFAHVAGSEPDGIAFDSAGRLLVAAFGSNDIVVLDQDGAVQERLPMGEGSRPTNLCFAGAELGTLVITLASGGRVVSVDRDIPGRPL